jgi:hypothetical protein
VVVRVGGVATAQVPAAQTAVQTPPAQASGPPNVQDAPPLRSAEATQRLQVALTPYLWLTGFSGSTRVQNITMNLDKNFAQIVGASDGAFGLMGALDVTYDRLVFQLNGAWTYAKFEEQRGIFRNGTVSATAASNTTWVEFLGGYRIFEAPRDPKAEGPQLLTLDAFVGGRVTMLDMDTTVRATTTVTLPDGRVLVAGASRRINASDSWIEPFVGMRAGFDLTGGWQFNLRGDIGGFGVDGSQFSWQVVAGVGYRWNHENWSMALFLGYRALSQDYTNGPFAWDMIVHGPMLGLQFQF